MDSPFLFSLIFIWFHHHHHHQILETIDNTPNQTNQNNNNISNRTRDGGGGNDLYSVARGGKHFPECSRRIPTLPSSSFWLVHYITTTSTGSRLYRMGQGPSTMTTWIDTFDWTRARARSFTHSFAVFKLKSSSANLLFFFSSKE